MISFWYQNLSAAEYLHSKYLYLFGPWENSVWAPQAELMKSKGSFELPTYVLKRWGSSWSQWSSKLGSSHLQTGWFWTRGKTTHGVPMKVQWKNTWRVLTWYNAGHSKPNKYLSVYYYQKGKKFPLTFSCWCSHHINLLVLTQVTLWYKLLFEDVRI